MQSYFGNSTLARMRAHNTKLSVVRHSDLVVLAGPTHRRRLRKQEPRPAGRVRLTGCQVRAAGVPVTEGNIRAAGSFNFMLFAGVPIHIRVEQPSDHLLIGGMVLISFGFEECNTGLAQCDRDLDRIFLKGEFFPGWKEIID